MDLTQLTFVGLVGIGVVNVITFFRPAIDSRLKFALSVVAVFAASFVPLEIGNTILEHAKTALTVALAASGTYKLASKAGGE